MYKPTILVIERNEDQWLLIQALMRQQFPEVKPMWMTNSVDVVLYLETCLQQRAELSKLILLNLQLPNLRAGLDLLQIIKTHHIYRQIPTITLGQSSKANDVLTSYQLGSNSYIVKPNSNETWRDCIASLRNYWWTTSTLPTIN